tara:strand:- start:1010 stop:1534 length:525 start_codon:yes stop_codon:yes gene_type:complete
MKFFFNYFIIIILIFSFNSASAENKIAYLDMQRVLNQSKVGISVNKKLTKMHKQNIDNFKKIEIELKKQEQDIISKKNILEKAELEKKLNELRKKSNDYRVDRKKKIDSLSKKRIDVTNNILKQLQPILTEYSDLESISLIVDKKSIVIGKTELDITDRIIELLNTKIKSVDLN